MYFSADVLTLEQKDEDLMRESKKLAEYGQVQPSDKNLPFMVVVGAAELYAQCQIRIIPPSARIHIANLMDGAQLLRSYPAASLSNFMLSGY